MQGDTLESLAVRYLGDKARRTASTTLLVTIVAGVLVCAILAMVLTKRARMLVPLCDKHRNHFLSRALLTWLGFAGIFVVALLCAAIAGRHDEVWLALLVYFVAWLVAAAIAGTTAIRPAEITDHYVRLTNVSHAFVSAHLALGPMPMPGPMPYGVPMPYVQPRA